ncbi:MAG: DUF2924 domain-containing protein [Rhodospirillales bacterium]|nr:DUF2924 domain-containing protein [Rhodospirillales bacterium]
MTGIETEVAALENLKTKELRGRRRRHYQFEAPPGLSRDLLIRAIAYKVQERMHGGLSASVKHKLRTLAAQLNSDDNGKFNVGTMLKPGTKLVREWRGRAHTVIVAEDGFEYDGKRYRSLSRIAREITGTRWSGPRFFGVAPSPKPVSPSETETGNAQP